MDSASSRTRPVRIADRVGCPLFALLVCSAVVTSSFTSDASAVRPVPVAANRVTIDDPFWSPKLPSGGRSRSRTVWTSSSVTAPWNFEHVARGEFDATHGGPPWYDGLIYELIRGGPT